MDSKRLRLSPEAERLESWILSRDRLQEQLEETYGSFCGPSFLWDTSQVFDLPHPSANRERNCPPRYAFVGRWRCEELLDRVLAQEPGQHMQVLGCKGSGKTLSLRTISGYLLSCKERKKVVYLTGARFVQSPFYTLLDALLLACGKQADDELARLTSMKNLVDWCCGLPDTDLLFVVDDWDAFERDGGKYADLQAVLFEASSDHILVMVSSIYSRQRQLWCQSDKAKDHIETFHFDGPYRSDELVTWMAQSPLKADQFQECERLTGGIPRLLSFYEAAEGREKVFSRLVSEQYCSKLNDRFISKMTSRSELAAALKLIITGERDTRLPLDKVDMTCFYLEEEEGRFHILSSYLRSVAESMVMDQHEILRDGLLVDDMEMWAAAVRVDCDEDVGATNPSCTGWNIEGLTISRARYNRELFGYRFKHYRKYERGLEKTVMAGLNEQLLGQGVLLAPAAFNEKAVDLIILKLVQGVLKIVGVQISVASWKLKSRKISHEVWVKEFLPMWMVKRRWKYEHEYYYVLPESVKLDDQVENAKFRTFAHVDSSLSEFDCLLDLAKPGTWEKAEVVRCKGSTKTGQPCQNLKACAAGEAFFCKAHEDQADRITMNLHCVKIVHSGAQSEPY